MSISTTLISQCSTRVQLAELLDVELSVLTYFAYGKGKKYKQFEIPKKSGGVRTITAPIGPLKQIQRKLTELFCMEYPGVQNAHGFIKNKSSLTNATQHVGQGEVLNIDLKDFFPSINAGRVMGLLKSAPFNLNNEVASTITGLVCFDNCLPQGAPTSPVISNMICLRMDKALYRLCRRLHVMYTRYADDITFSSARKLPPTIAVLDTQAGRLTLGMELMTIIDENHFTLNSKKTRLYTGSQAKYVTGVKVNVFPNVTRKYVREVRAMLHDWSRNGLEHAQARFECEFNGGGRKIENVIIGKLDYLRSVKYSDDLVWARLYNRYIDLAGTSSWHVPVGDIERLHRRVFVISSGHKNGTGFVANGHGLITCDHVVRDLGDIKYFPFDNWPPTGSEWVQPIETSRSPVGKFDLTLLSVRDETTLQTAVFELAPNDFNVGVGMRFRVIGFPSYTYGSTPHVMTVEVTALRENGGECMHAFVGQKLIGGYSGGPVLDDQNRIVGVVQQGENGANSLHNTFLPIQEMRKYFASLADCT